MADILSKMKVKKGTLLLAVGVIAGLLLILFPTSESKESKKTEAEIKDEIALTDSYIKTLEERVKYLIESMDGISNVNVIITAKECIESVYAQNSRYDGGSLSEKEYIMSDEDGKPVKLKLVYPKIKGVAVVCTGGGNPINQEKIVSLLSSLLDIKASSVYVSA